jgi:hypothetical protein
VEEAYKQSKDVISAKQTECTRVKGLVQEAIEELDGYKKQLIAFGKLPGSSANKNPMQMQSDIVSIFPSLSSNLGGTPGKLLQHITAIDNIKKDANIKNEYYTLLQTIVADINNLMTVARPTLTFYASLYEQEKSELESQRIIAENEKVLAEQTAAATAQTAAAERAAAVQRQIDEQQRLTTIRAAEATERARVLQEKLDLDRQAAAAAAQERMAAQTRAAEDARTAAAMKTAALAQAAADAKTVAATKAAAEAQAAADAKTVADAATALALKKQKEDAELAAAAQTIAELRAARTARATAAPTATNAAALLAAEQKRQEEETLKANFLKKATTLISGFVADDHYFDDFKTYIKESKKVVPSICADNKVAMIQAITKEADDLSLTEEEFVKMMDMIDVVDTESVSAGGNKYKRRSIKRAKRRISTRKINNKQKNNERLSTKIVRRWY